MLWFLDNLVTFPVSHDGGGDGISVMEARSRRGASPPYHLHHAEDEVSHLIEGDLVLLVDGKTTLPAPSGPLSPEQQQALAELSLRHGIELIGPPLAEDVAEAA